LKGSYKVDNLGAKRVIDSCVEAKVQKVVLVSSLLTNGFRAGQFLNPQYLLLNAFGGKRQENRFNYDLFTVMRCPYRSAHQSKFKTFFFF
jgi:hypothetical protein